MVSGTNDRWLKMGVALPLMYEKLEPALIWPDYLKLVPEENNSFMYRYDSTGKSSDTKKETPPQHAFPANLPELDRSRKSVSSAILEARGFSMRIPRSIIRDVKLGPNEIRDCYETAGYWLAEYINTSILTAMTAGATTPTWTPTAVWSGATATPVTDLIDFSKAFRREGYPFRFTDGFVDEDNFYELAESVTIYDADYQSKDKIFGILDLTKDIIRVPAAKCTIHLVMSGMTHGYLLGLDRNNKATELHYYNDPKFASAKVSYRTTDAAGSNGAPKTVTVPNIGIHFKQYEENDTHDTIMQFWYENKTVVTKPYGLNYDSGI